MKPLSFLRRLLAGKPAPAPVPPASDPKYVDVLMKYADVLIRENQLREQLNEALTKLAETNQLYAETVRELSRSEIENANLRMILSGNYRTDRKPDPIY